MKTRFTLRLAVLAVLLGCGAAHAVTYSVSGRFGTGTYTGPLNGGSFSGVFDFSRPTLGSFDMQLRDASGALRFELTNANSTGSFFANWGSSGYDALQFVTLGSQSTATILTLDFALGFTGTGTVVPYPAGFPYASFATLGGQTMNTTSTVISGLAVAVPEPAPALLLSLGLLPLWLLGRARSRMVDAG